MYGDVTIERPAAEALLIPADALVEGGKRRYVFVALAGGRFEPREVKIGARTSEEVEILEGLQEGEVVVTTANFLIDSESRLRAAITGQASAGGAPAATGGGQGPSCERDFDRVKHPEAYDACRACELQHRGMGTMEEDCKKAISKPWR
jgi:membrane fusion protein, copper/silver efflux system